MTDECGVVYVATGPTYLEEAKTSVASLRQHHDIPATIFVSRALHADAAEVFDDVRVVDDPHHDFRDSMLTPEMVVYPKTLFLDTDTYVAGDIAGVFEALDRHDAAVARDPTVSGSVDHQTGYDVPEWWPQFNTGVMALRDTERVHRLLDDWHAIHNEVRGGVLHDLNQPAFRIATFRWGGSTYVLPPEYNWRYSFYGGGFAGGEVKILHDRFVLRDIGTVAERVNATDGPRLIRTGLVCRVQPHKRGIGWLRFYARRLAVRYRNEGLSRTCRRAIRFGASALPGSPIAYDDDGGVEA